MFSIDKLLEYLLANGVDAALLEPESSLEIESLWRSIYARAFLGRPRLRSGVKAEGEYSRILSTHYWIIPFNSNLPGTPVHVQRGYRAGFECRGRLLPLGDFHAIEFFVAPLDLDWTMVHTHEDHQLGGPYFLLRDWL